MPEENTTAGTTFLSFPSAGCLLGTTAGIVWLGVLSLLIQVLACQTAMGASRSRNSAAIKSSPSNQLAYPQFRSSSGIIHWLPEQMPLKVYVSHGLCLDKIIDEASGAPVCNVDNLAQWPDLAASVLESESELAKLPVAEGFCPGHFEAAKQGIISWYKLAKDGVLTYQFTDDPFDADIYVFWVHHFVNKLGMALFANDIRGYTAKRSFWLRDIQAGKQPRFKPVVIVLRTTDSVGRPMPLPYMKASCAHEFGHALGIEGHSNNPHDLMSVYYGNGTISNSDAATIRYLYRLVPDLVP